MKRNEKRGSGGETKLKAESSKIQTQSSKLQAQSSNLQATGYKLQAQSSKLQATSSKLKAQSYKVNLSEGEQTRKAQAELQWIVAQRLLSALTIPGFS